jgi:hypothetical protein
MGITLKTSDAALSSGKRWCISNSQSDSPPNFLALSLIHQTPGASGGACIPDVAHMLRMGLGPFCS